MNKIKGYLLTAVTLAVVAFFHYGEMTRLQPMRGVSVIYGAGTEDLKGKDRDAVLRLHEFIGCGEFRFTFDEKKADYIFYPAGDEMMLVVTRQSEQVIYEGPLEGACEAIKQLEN